MKLSIIVSVYGDMENVLVKCINSITTNVGIEDYECILVDGNSSSNTLNWCNSLQKDNSNFTYIRINNYDENEIRNIGMKYATGEYLYFINGCNLLCNNFLNEAIEYLDKNKNIDVFVRNYKVLNENNIEPVYSYFTKNEIGPLLSACVFRKSAINIKFQNEFCGDIIFSGKIIQLKNKMFFEETNTNSFILNQNFVFSNSIDYVSAFNLDWKKYVIEEIKSYTKRKFDLSYHVIDKCNKNCIACGHFSPLADENDEGVTPEQFKKDMEAAKFLLPNVKTFILTGGEPTLNKNLVEIIKIATTYFGNIRLCSNGLNKDFFINNAEFLNKNNITVFITKYSLENYNKIKELLNNVYFYTIPSLEDETGKRVEFNYKHLSKNRVNTDRKYYCDRGACTQLRDEKLYLCQYSANFHVFKKYFNNVKFEFDDKNTYLDLTEVNDIDKVLDFIFYQYSDMCEHCRQPLYDHDVEKNTVPLVKSNYNLTEWYE